MSDRDQKNGREHLSRRHLLLGGAAAGVGAASAIAADLTLNPAARTASAVNTSPATVADGPFPFYGTHEFYGTHQAGIDTQAGANISFIALDLHEDVDRGALRRMMRILSDDAARLTQGRSALADSEPELAEDPAALTVTFGFGEGFVRRAAGESARPSWLAPLPPFGIDRLEDAWSSGDFLIQIGAEDPLPLAHATRMLLKDTRSFARVRWTQTGFRRLTAGPHGNSIRNLFGQIDGTVNPVPGTADFDGLVWVNQPGSWMHGGTSLVLRRIAMDLDTWDHVDRPGREQAVGRRLDNGAPLTGSAENDEPDFAAKTPLGFPVISDVAHMRRARTGVPGERIFRRGYNYDDPVGADPSGTEQISRSGLLFASYQADVNAQFVPIQRRLDQMDMLNEWTTPIGSAVFAIPPGASSGSYVGAALLNG